MTGLLACVFCYTGKERDAESGNDYFGARYYASTMGRFMSPDPSGLYYADPTNPQSFNLYSYALNNPLRFIDPSGLIPCDYGSSDTHEGNDYENADSDKECTDNGGTVLTNPPTTVTVRPDGNSGCSGNCIDTGVAGALPQTIAPQVDPDKARIAGLVNGVATNTKSLKCAQEALGKNGVSLTLDAAGFIPVESQAAAIVQLGVGTASFVNSLHENDAAGAVLSIKGGQITAADMAYRSVGEELPKAIPFIGYGFNVIGTIRDAGKVKKDYDACMSRP